MSLTLSFLLASPRGEVAARSDDGEGVCASQLIYRVATKNFPANRLASCVFHTKYEEAISGRQFRVEPGRSAAKLALC